MAGGFLTGTIHGWGTRQVWGTGHTRQVWGTGRRRDHNRHNRDGELSRALGPGLFDHVLNVHNLTGKAISQA